MSRSTLRRPFASARALALVGALGVLLAAPARAQEPAPMPATHTVKRGDTLWDIAKMYLNDPFLWPEIYRLNSDVVEDPHWIYPGEVLKLPGAGPSPTTQVVSEDQVEKNAPEQPVTEQAPAVVGTTVFSVANKRRVLSASRFGGTANTYLHTAVRPDEFYGAPWLDRASGPAAYGEIVRTANMPGEVRGVMRDKFTTDDYVFFTVPKGVVAAKGDMYLVYRTGEDFGNGTQVMFPTGLLRVVEVNGNDAVLGQLTRFYTTVRLGQRVIPLEKFSMDPNARPAPLLLGTEGKIVWIPDNITVASKEDYLMLDVGLKDGVKIGDQFTIYKPRTKLQTETGITTEIPEVSIGVVQVVKVTDYGATALVVDVRYPNIIPGSYARLTARMP
ncbi:MAG TPA: LysM peptidoglycan-binding domain-containing protein [Gemmatimonadaceae bacterium]|nr:LysM peptidoglycan-binding domain-containing protein [Gemmatimonadaceae bacterium]